MTKNEKDLIKKTLEKIENIVNYHNKNLTKKQYFDLLESLKTLKNIK